MELAHSLGFGETSTAQTLRVRRTLLRTITPPHARVRLNSRIEPAQIGSYLSVPAAV